MSEYELVNDQYYGQWINKPDNMGDVGDLREITDELNRILSELNEAREQNAKLRNIAERLADELRDLANPAFDEILNEFEELKLKEDAK